MNCDACLHVDFLLEGLVSSYDQAVDVYRYAEDFLPVSQWHVFYDCMLSVR